MAQTVYVSKPKGGVSCQFHANFLVSLLLTDMRLMFLDDNISCAFQPV